MMHMQNPLQFPNNSNYSKNYVCKETLKSANRRGKTAFAIKDSEYNTSKTSL